MDSIADRLAPAPPLTRSRWMRWGDGGVEALVTSEPDARFHLHWHEEWSLGAIEAGTCDFSCDRRRARARRGDLVLIPPRAVHAAATSSPRFAMVMLYLPVEVVADRLGLDPGTTPSLARHRVSLPSEARALAGAVRAGRLERVWPAFAAALAACRSAPPADLPLVPVDPRIERVAALLRAADRVPDVGELARQVELSREHLHRLFRSSLGVTPGQYVRLSRMAVARDRLRRGDRIAEVALACGFTDQAHFSRWFRRYLGVTPRAFASPASRPSASSHRPAPASSGPARFE